ncbi:hypothetical protein KQX54_015369 [Cotesia glomerata]|uniref:Uncharacterized protein n=1 Tax=Cotesia glomerata TaxID=32391 RepID=A0AAV7IY55_COTGL|nr:hypothetical protein KQX54_015369 [Cotesia glomerata]
MEVKNKTKDRWGEKEKNEIEYTVKGRERKHQTVVAMELHPPLVISALFVGFLLLLLGLIVIVKGSLTLRLNPALRYIRLSGLWYRLASSFALLPTTELWLWLFRSSILKLYLARSPADIVILKLAESRSFPSERVRGDEIEKRKKETLIINKTPSIKNPFVKPEVRPKYNKIELAVTELCCTVQTRERYPECFVVAEIRGCWSLPVNDDTAGSLLSSKTNSYFKARMLTERLCIPLQEEVRDANKDKSEIHPGLLLVHGRRVTANDKRG